MNYHPIMGISILIICIIIAYFIGKIISKKNILRWKKDSSTKINNTEIGDASSPDAPWMKKNK